MTDTLTDLQLTGCTLYLSEDTPLKLLHAFQRSEDFIITEISPNKAVWGRIAVTGNGTWQGLRLMQQWQGVHGIELSAADIDRHGLTAATVIAPFCREIYAAANKAGHLVGPLGKTGYRTNTMGFTMVARTSFDELLTLQDTALRATITSGVFVPWVDGFAPYP